MACDMLRVKYSLVLPGYEDLEPPYQPQGWDSDVPGVLSIGFSYLYLWPNRHIRLGTEGQGTTLPQPAQPAHEDFEMAQNPAVDDDDNFDTNQFINTRYCDEYQDQGGQLTQKVVEPEPAPGPSTKPSCVVLVFSSQDTPPLVAFTEPQRAVPMISPGTLHRVAGEVIETPHKVPEKGKKGRKRKPKSASRCQRPIHQDGPAEKSRRLVHMAATLMMNPQLLAVATTYMRSLHHSCR